MVDGGYVVGHHIQVITGGKEQKASQSRPKKVIFYNFLHTQIIYVLK
jgi:hypothetical protein